MLRTPFTTSPRALTGRLIVAAALVLAVAGCGDSTTAPSVGGFLAGTSSNRQIGLVVNSTGKSLTLFQVGDPSMQEVIPLGSSSTVTPTGFSTSGTLAAVPLGNTASVALIDLQTPAITRYFTFAAGNTTGSAFSDDTTLILTNTGANVVGRVSTTQVSDNVTTTVAVPPQPTAIVMANGLAFVVSGNEDETYTPIGNGIVTAIDPKTMEVKATITTGGTNSTAAALGPDGLLYVVNTGDYVADGTVTIIDPATLLVVTTVAGFGPGPGDISIDSHGLAYVSEFFAGTVVWNTTTRAFVRGPDNPVCAMTISAGCRGAFGATASEDGTLYQLFFGDAPHGLAPYTFVYSPSTFTLSDSISVGTGPSAIAIRKF